MIGLDLEANALSVADILKAREEFLKTQPVKQPLAGDDFDSALKNAEFAVIGMDTDAFDLRQRLEPLLNNPNLNPDQFARVALLRQKLYKVLTEHGLMDGWNAAIREVSEAVG